MRHDIRFSKSITKEKVEEALKNSHKIGIAYRCPKKKLLLLTVYLKFVLIGIME